MARKRKKKKGLGWKLPVGITTAVVAVGAVVFALTRGGDKDKEENGGAAGSGTSTTTAQSQYAATQAKQVLSADAIASLALKSAGLSLEAEAGSATFEGGIDTTGSKIVGGLEKLTGLGDLDISSGFKRSEIESDGAYFPPSYPSKTAGTLNLQKVGEAANWNPQTRSEMLLQHDKAMSPIYEKWKGLSRARKWLGAAGVPLLYSNTRSSDPRFSEGRVLMDMLKRGAALRLAPAILTFDPKVAKLGGAIWIPPEEPASYGPTALKTLVDRQYQRSTLRSAVWDGTGWTTIPWHSFGLEHRLPNTGIYPDRGFGVAGIALEMAPASGNYPDGKVKEPDLSLIELPANELNMILSILSKTFA